MRLQNKLQKYTVNLLVAGVSTLLMLLIFEAGFRVRAHLENRGILDGTLDPGIEPPPDGDADLGHMIRLARNRRMVYEFKPNLTVNYQGSRVTLNSQGFRGVDHAVDKEGDVFRILGIGDSFMFGQGVEDDEPYLALLEAELNRRQPARHWQVINTAVPGYNTVMEVEALKDKGLRYSPDLVIVEWVSNDLSLPNFIRQKEDVFSLEKSFLMSFFSKGKRKNLRRPMLERLAMNGIISGLTPQGNSRDPVNDLEQVPPEYQDLVGWEAYRAAMTELKQLQEEHGFTVLSITLKPERTRLEAQVEELSRELGFQVLDVGADVRRTLEEGGYRRYLESPLALSPMDGHPSAAGHKLAAQSLLAMLVRQGIVQDAAGEAALEGTRALPPQ